MEGSKGESTRVAIRQAAAAAFRQHGYDETSLQDIGNRLGLSPATILHHFGSKSELLRAVIAPYLDALTRLVERYKQAALTPVAQRRRLLAELTDLSLAHAAQAGILSWDIAVGSETDFTGRLSACRARIRSLLTGPHPAEADPLIATAILGAVLRPLSDPRIDPYNLATRAAILNEAYGMANKLGVE